MKSNQIQFSYYKDGILFFVLCCSTRSNITHILPLPLSGLYIYILSVRRMVMDNIVLVKSSCWPWWHPGESPTYIFHEEYIQNTRAWTAYHETCGTEYQQPNRRCNSQTAYYKWNMAQARPLSVLHTTQFAKFSFNHPSVVLTPHVFQYCYKNYVHQLLLRSIS